MILKVGGRRAALKEEEVTARFRERDLLRSSRVAQLQISDGGPVRSLIELSIAYGGITSRALLGGKFPVIDAYAGKTRFEVLFSDALVDNVQEATCISNLGRNLVPGLPADFSQATISGLVHADAPFPSGRLRVDRAGYDEIRSSEMAFRLGETC